MYKRLLVPLDGSELAEISLQYAKELAVKLSSEITLLTVCTPKEPLERALDVYLEKRSEELQLAGIKADYRIMHGEAASEILGFADSNETNLIIMSTHGGSAADMWSLGSIARKIVEKSHVPTLLIRPHQTKDQAEPGNLRKIVLPLDGSEFAEAIIPYVCNLAKASNSELTLLRIIQPTDLVLLQRDLDWEENKNKYETEVEREARDYLKKREHQLRSEGLQVRSMLLHGDASQSILNYVEDNSVDLIALATHGISGITKWVFGSVASKIIHSSVTPILLIRPDAANIGH